jgi:hypothetical protein
MLSMTETPNPNPARFGFRLQRSSTHTSRTMMLEELRGVLKMPKSTRNKLVREGKLPSQKIGLHGRLRQEAMGHWPEETRVNEPGSGEDR